MLLHYPDYNDGTGLFSKQEQTFICCKFSLSFICVLPAVFFTCKRTADERIF
jgi:hypothetical protein